MPLFDQSHRLVGMLHVPALPGTPAHSMDITAIVDHVVSEAQTLIAAGFNALLLENMHDAPYLKGQVGPEIVASMTTVARAVRAETTLPLGIQILAAANREALAVAKAAGLQFLRAEGFVFGHVADEGYIDACAGELLRYRKLIGAEDVQVFCDLKKKHSSHAVTADVSLAETAQAAEFFQADGVIVTGTATGAPADPADLDEVKAATKLPLLVGSGITPESVAEALEVADGVIVGSSIKQDGHWANPIDLDAAKRVVEAVGT